MSTPESSNVSSAGGPQKTPLPTLPAALGENRMVFRRQLKILAGLAAVLVICFIKPLYDLAGFSMDSQFFSYIPLMPVITAYLIWLRRAGLGAEVRPAWGAALAAAIAGGAILAAYGWVSHAGWRPFGEDYLAAMTLSFLLMLLAAGFASLGTTTMAAIAFPVSLLIFMVPYPEFALDGIESFFQQTSAATACGMLHLAGTTVLKNGLELTLPAVPPDADHPLGGMSLRVAPECSGIHSSQVLLITSLLAGNLFLRSSWRRAALALFIVPLAIARNGFRIFVISELCIHIGPQMIHSPIHHQK